MPGSLISGARGVIYGVNQDGKIFDTYFNGPLSRFATLDTTSGVLPLTLAVGGDADGYDAVYGLNSSGGIVRAWWVGDRGWHFASVPTWGGRIVSGSLISGDGRVFGVNEFGKLVNTYPDAGVIKYGIVEGRADFLPGSLALGGTPKTNSGVYGVATSGVLIRAFWNGDWRFQTASPGSPVAAGSLISGPESSVYGLNAKGQLFTGYVDSGAFKTAAVGDAAGLMPGSLAIAGRAQPFNDIYGIDSQGRLVRTFYVGLRPGTLSIARDINMGPAPRRPLPSWVSAVVSGVTVAPKSLVSSDDGVFGLDITGRPFAVTLVSGVPTVVYPCPPPSPGAAQMKAHKKVLQAFGIDNLAALGNLKLSGDVIPQPGLLRAQPSPVAATTQFKAARKAVTVGGKQDFMPLSGNGFLLKAEPFPSFKTSGLDIPLDTAYIAAQWLNLADDTHLILKFPNRHLVILVENLTVGKNVTVTYERQPSEPAAKPGTPGTPGTPGVPSGHPVKGTTGTGGTAGTAGSKGWSFTNSAAPDVEIWVLNMTGSPAFDLRGQDGGAGAPGGDGGNGGNGSAGTPSDGNWLYCNYGPGDGGDGGGGGRAGDGGAGGDGAPGGRLTMYAPSTVLAAYSSGFFLTVDGGAAGPGGIPGTPGAGGAAGPVGQVNGDACKSPAAGRRAGSAGAQGAAASQGAPGKAGAPQTTPAPVRFLPILPDEFYQAWEKPALESLTPPGSLPGKAYEGDLVSVKGQRFSHSDNVWIDNGPGQWIPCVTQIHANTLLSFKVPAVQGGLHTVVLEQTTSTSVTRSNALSLYVLPRLGATQPGPRIRPGSTVGVTGSGFAPGMRVFLNGQESGTLTYTDPDTQKLFVVRPKAGIPFNPAGEPASLTLALADGTLTNALSVILDTYQIVVLGDSVAWGTGLQDQQKFSALVEQRVKDLNQASNIGVYREVKAHTGAILGLSLKPPGQPGLPAIPGEVPTAYPTISEQLDIYAHDPNSANVDLVLLDGCINDVGVFVLLDPQRSTGEIGDLTSIACHNDMLTLLSRAAPVFPGAKIVVNSYFAPLGPNSAGARLVAFLIAIDNPVVQIPSEIVGGLLKPGTRDRVIQNSLFFANKSTEQLALAVKDANQAMGGQVRIFFADPHFGPQNAALSGSDSWLFGINSDGSAEDLLAGTRKNLCQQYKDRTDTNICIHASAGHPNVTGAQRFAEAIFPFL